MKTLAYLAMIVSLAWPALAQAQNKDIRADIQKDIPLAEAIRRVNEQYPDAQPLTEQEVVAAVQAIKLQHPEIKEATHEVYQRVVKDRVLPAGMYFSRIQEWNTEYGVFEVDWKDLTLTSLPVGTKDEKIGYGFNYRIRARFISSRPRTEAEAKALKEKMKLVDEKMKQVEPVGPANGSQPIRSETNSRSSAAGSRR